MVALKAEHLEWLKVKGYTERTVVGRDKHLEMFLRWCDERDLRYPKNVNLAILERYQRHLFYHRKQDGSALSLRTQRGQLLSVQLYFKWLCKKRHLLSNPASELELPRAEKRLPRAILTHEEVEAVMSQPDVTTPIGLRDRAILEVIYSTGMRRLELCSLCIDDLVQERGLVFIRQGKGRKDRVLPIGERALLWIRKYVEEVWQGWQCSLSEKHLFLTNYGEPILPKAVTGLARRYVIKADIGKRGSCHLLRHTMATLMLENGADIRFIQQMLGHASLETTDIYTHVSVQKLKHIHSETHPGARMKRSKSG